MAKSVLTPQTILKNGDMSLGSVTSANVSVQFMDNIGLQIQWTGAPVGVIAVNGSVDGITYYALTFDPVLTQPAGSAGGYLVDLNQFPFVNYNVSYTKTSGTGSLTVITTEKGL